MSMRRRYLDSSSGQVHAREFGSGDELVLLLHQTASSSAMFERFADELQGSPLTTSHRFVAIDTPGFGQSFLPSERYSVQAWAALMIELGTALGDESSGEPGGSLGNGFGRERGFHVLGHHTGAAIAIAAAAAAPDLVLSLGMIGALGLTAEERVAWHAGVSGMRIDDQGGHLSTAWTQVATIDGDPLAYPPDLELRHREVVDKLSAGARWHEAYLAVFETDLLALLAATTCPALLVCGTADVLHPYVAATLAARPGIEYAELAAGAYVLDQDPALIAEVYGAFLLERSARSTPSASLTAGALQ